MIYFTSSEKYTIPLPENHTFPMDKYALVQEQLLYEGLISPQQILQAPLLREEEALTVHTPEYWQKIRDCAFTEKDSRKIGFPNSTELRDRSLSSAGGTLLCARNALKYGIALNLAGGTHHAFAERGEGYCVLNDMAIAAACVLSEPGVKKVLIVDLDVHQGNGTAAIFREDPRVFTFSMHCKDNYPMRKETSDLDIALAAGCTDTEYLKILYSTLPELILRVKPDLIFYQAGVDVLENDRLGKLSLSYQGCGLRDEFVFSQAKAAGIPIVSVMGGGYHTTLPGLVQAHTQTFRKALHIYS